MEKLTYDELMTKLQADYSNVSDFAHSGVQDVDVPEDYEPLADDDYDTRRARRDKYVATLGYGEVKEVDSHGGEGEGEDWWVVFHFIDHDVHIKVDGWYQSHNGTEFEEGWGSCSEVTPTQKTITVYE